jgi:hypothetical protein
MLEEMFNAFRRHFLRPPQRREEIDVYFLANSGEYAAFQQATRGGVSPNPALFRHAREPRGGLLRGPEGRRSPHPGNILASEREIEDYKRKIAARRTGSRRPSARCASRAGRARRAPGAPDDPEGAGGHRPEQADSPERRSRPRSGTRWTTWASSGRDANQSIQQHEARDPPQPGRCW